MKLLYKVVLITTFVCINSFKVNATADFDIARLQSVLTELGYNPGSADGFWGPKTKKALIQYLTDTNVASDGNLSENHYQVLGLQQCSKIQSSNDQESLATDFADVNLMSNFQEAAITFLPRYKQFSNGKKIDHLAGEHSGGEVKLIADFNNDGLDDIMIEYAMVNVAPVFLFSRGDGTFDIQDNYTSGAKRKQIRKALAADINLDGWLDVIGFTTSDALESLYWARGEADVLLLNQNGQGFYEKQIPEWTKNDYNHGGNVADLNNDGLLDILPVSEEPRQSTGPLLNDGKSFALGPTSYSARVKNEASSSLDVGDINQDGYVDLVFAITPFKRHQTGFTSKHLNEPHLQVIFGDGDANFKNNLKMNFGTHWITSKMLKEFKSNAKDFIEEGRDFATAKPSNVVDGGTSNVTLVDLNADGYLDILVGYWLAAGPLQITSGFKAFVKNGDCFIDETDAFFPNQRMNRELTPNKQTAYIHDFFIGDITGDGHPDVVVQMDGTMYYADSSEKYSPHIFINDGQNRYLPPTKNNAPAATFPKYRRYPFKEKLRVEMHSLGDFDGDGKKDLAFIKRGFHSQRLYVHLQRSAEQLKMQRQSFDQLIEEYQGTHQVLFFESEGKKQIVAEASLKVSGDLIRISDVNLQSDEFPHVNLETIWGHVKTNGKVEIFSTSSKTAENFGDCLFFAGDLFENLELQNKPFDYGMEGKNNCRDFNNIWPISIKLLPN